MYSMTSEHSSSTLQLVTTTTTAAAHDDNAFGPSSDTLRLGCQLSAARDDAEDLRRALTRKEVELRTVTSERNAFHEEAGKLRYDLDTARRVINDLTNIKLELSAARDVLQQKLADALEEIARREDQRAAEQAVHQNVVRQQQLSEAHLSLMQERLLAMEAEQSKKLDELRSAAHRSDIYRSCVTREVSAAAAAMERAMLSPESGSDEAIASDLALLSLVADSSADVSSGIDSGNTAALRSSTTRDVKAAFQPLYEVSKQLSRHFAEARADKKRLREYQQHQQQHVDAMAEDLTHVVQEKAQLLTKVSQCEVHIARLSSQQESLQRAAEESAAVHARHLTGLAAALRCVEDWTAVEAQARNTTAKADLLQTRCREQQEDLQAIKDSFALQQDEFDQRLLRESERMRQQKDDGIRAARESALRALEEKDRVAAAVDTVKETTVALQLEHDNLRVKYSDALAEVDRLTHDLRQAQREVTQLQAQVTATSRENELLISIQAKEKRAAEAERQTAVRRAQAAADAATDGSAMTPFEALIVTLKVLNGMRRDVGELCEQRRALGSQVRELEQRNGGLLASMELPARVRVLLRFRRGAIVVLAANRLRRLLRPQYREVRHPARRSAMRIRLTPDAAVFVMNGLVQRAADRDVSSVRFISEADVPMPRMPEAANIASVVSGLLLGVRTGTVLPPPTAPSGPLHRLLQDGLHRLLLATVRVGSSGRSHPPPPARSMQLSSDDDRRISPPRTSRRAAAGDAQKSALKSSTPRHHFASNSSSHVLQHPVTPSLVSPAPSSSRTHRRANASATDMSSQSYSEDFTLEVLNVIRALDNKVTGALRRPHLALA